MKGIYWRPRTVSRNALVLIAVLAVGGLVAVERFPVHSQLRYFQQKKDAADLAEKAFNQIRARRDDLAPPIDPETDPTETGLIGLAASEVTSDTGDLAAKQTSINPNFAAVVVELLEKAGVKPGDAVAIGWSGSFPALNVCTAAAVQTLELKPVAVASAAASTWGANLPDFLWLDMEKLLGDDGILSFRSAAASLGGREDRGLGITDEGRRLIREAIRRNGVTFLDAGSAKDSIDRRMKIFNDFAKQNKTAIKAYINVGGGGASVGTAVGKRMFKPGLNLYPPLQMGKVDGVMERFSRDSVPVIHLTQIQTLAKKYGMPTLPQTLPTAGEGAVFQSEDYNYWLVSGVLALVCISLYAFIRSDFGFRVLQTSGRGHDQGHPQPMV